MPLSPGQIRFLHTSFTNTAEALSLRTLRGAFVDEMLAAYEEPHRHYHNAAHLFHCITELENTPPPHNPHVALALWFHDAIYDPTRKDNEPRCANLAALYAPLLGIRPDTLLAVQRLILATDHRAAPNAPDESLIIDIDLAILGQSPSVFDAYEHAIRKEYAHIPDAQFNPARASILRKFLARPTIYYTPHFHTRYESQARANLTRSLQKLRPESN